MQTTTMTDSKKHFSVRSIAVIGMLSAVASVLMILEFPVPFVPAFIKMDLSELPALIGAFAFGPMAGVTICLIKNLVHLLFTTSGGVGELSNFLLGACFVLPAGLIYKLKKTRGGALLGVVAGDVLMAAASIPINYFVVYPVYTAFMPMEVILSMYQAILPGIKTLLQALLIFNAPFTFVKGALSVGITFLIYKTISPFLKGETQKRA